MLLPDTPTITNVLADVQKLHSRFSERAKRDNIKSIESDLIVFQVRKE